MKRKLVFTMFFVGIAVLCFPLFNALTAQEQGQVKDSLPIEGGVNQSVWASDLQVSVKGVKGKQLKVYNAPKLITLEDFDEYVTKRKAKLTDLATSDSNREIEVAISPSQRISLDDFGAMAQSHGLQFEELSLDVYVADKWARMVWFDKTTSLVDISQGSQRIAERIIEIESSAPSPPGSVPTAIRTSGQTEIAVRFVRGRLRAQEAIQMQDNPRILLVDPISDIQDAFTDQAQEVRVSQMPHLYVQREGKFGTNYRRENTVEGSSPIKDRSNQ